MTRHRIHSLLPVAGIVLASLLPAWVVAQSAVPVGTVQPAPSGERDPNVAPKEEHPSVTGDDGQKVFFLSSPTPAPADPKTTQTATPASPAAPAKTDKDPK
jgi:hypothetical protein